MDKYEYQVCADQINALSSEGRYAEAMDIADTIDWRRVKSFSMLCRVSEIYKVNKHYEESREILLLAYERYPDRATVIYALCELDIKLGDVKEAKEFYKEYVALKPNDTNRYVLLYRLYEAMDYSLEDKISLLEEFKRAEYTEKWAYELAVLYHKTGQESKCVETCDELILWFGEGTYVRKAMELKMQHANLSDDQKRKYDGNATQPKQNIQQPVQQPVQQPAYQPQQQYTQTAPQQMAVPYQDERMNTSPQYYQNTQPQMYQNAYQNTQPQMYQDVYQNTQPQDYLQNSSYATMPIQQQYDQYQQPGYMQNAYQQDAYQQNGYQQNQYPQNQYQQPEYNQYSQQPMDAPLNNQQYGSQTYSEPQYSQGYDNYQGIQVQPISTGKYSTINLQEELAKNMQEIYGKSNNSIEANYYGNTSSLYEPSQQEYMQSLNNAGAVSDMGNDQMDYYSNDMQQMPMQEENYNEEESVKEMPMPVMSEASVAVPTVTAPLMTGINSESAEMSKEIPVNDSENQKYEKTLEPETFAVKEEPDSKNLEKNLSQEYNGQISMSLPEPSEDIKQITGQIDISDFLKEWEEKKAIAKKQSMDATRRRQIEQTNDIMAQLAGVIPGIEIAMPEEEQGLNIPIEHKDELVHSDDQEIVTKTTIKAPSYDNGRLQKPELEIEPEIPNIDINSEIPSEKSEEIPEEKPELNVPEEVSKEVKKEEKPIVLPDYLREQIDEEKKENSEVNSEEDSEEDSIEETISDNNADLESENDSEPEKEPEDIESDPEENMGGISIPEITYEMESEPESASDMEEEKSEEDNSEREPEIEDEIESDDEEPELVADEKDNDIEPEPDSNDQSDVVNEDTDTDSEEKEDEPVKYPFDVTDTGEVEEIEEIEQSDEVADILKTGAIPLFEIEQQTDYEAGIEAEEEKKPSVPSYMVLDEKRVARREFYEEELRIFGRFEGIESLKAQIVDVMDYMSMDAAVGNVVVTGSEIYGRKALAIDIVKAMQSTEVGFTGKVAKISGEALNKKDIAMTLHKLHDGALIVENAGGLNPVTINTMTECLSQGAEPILVVLEDEKDVMEPLLTGCKEMEDVFDARIEMEDFSNDDLVSYARGYAREQEYSIDDMGELALHTRISELQSSIDGIVTVEDIKDMIDAAIRHVDKKNMSHFMDVLLGKRYDDDDYIILGEKDFNN